MKNHLQKSIVLSLATLLLLSACSTLATPNPGPLIPGLAQTLAAQTLTAAQGGQLAGFSLDPSQTPAVALPTAEIQPTSTPGPIETPQSPNQNNSLVGSVLQPSEKCTNAAEFIQDISVPDYSVMRSGERFIKTWQFKNIGTCTWTPDYSLIFVWGAQMGGVSPKPLGQTIAPGQYVEISTELKAPKDVGSYQGSWIFQDPEGNQFGTGYQARNFFWVNIVIQGKLERFIGGEGGCIAGG